MPNVIEFCTFDNHFKILMLNCKLLYRSLQISDCLNFRNLYNWMTTVFASLSVGLSPQYQLVTTLQIPIRLMTANGHPRAQEAWVDRFLWNRYSNA